MAIKFDGADSVHGMNDGLPWMPLPPPADHASMKLYALDRERGTVAVLLRIPPGTGFAPRRCSAPVAIFTLQGRWKYLENDWVAGPGSVVIAPADVLHTPYVLADGTDDAIVLLLAEGDQQWRDAQDGTIGSSDWRASLDRYRAYCRRRGANSPDVAEPRD